MMHVLMQPISWSRPDPQQMFQLMMDASTKYPSKSRLTLAWVAISNHYVSTNASYLEALTSMTNPLVFAQHTPFWSVYNGTHRCNHAIIQPTNYVRNLGYIYDAELKNNSHINKLVSTCYVTLRRISGIRDLLDYDTCRILVQALALSKVDYWNSLLLGSSQYVLDKLQKILNMGAWVISRKRKYDHISKDIQELHWLKIPEWIQDKVAVLTSECVKGDAPTYLKDLINTTHNHAYSTTNNYLPVSMSKLSQVHKSSFSIMAGRIWNDLPFNLRSTDSSNIFKTGLKTVLFCKSHNL